MAHHPTGGFGENSTSRWDTFDGCGDAVADVIVDVFESRRDAVDDNSFHIAAKFLHGSLDLPHCLHALDIVAFYHIDGREEADSLIADHRGRRPARREAQVLGGIVEGHASPRAVLDLYSPERDFIPAVCLTAARGFSIIGFKIALGELKARVCPELVKVSGNISLQGGFILGPNPAQLSSAQQRAKRTALVYYAVGALLLAATLPGTTSRRGKTHRIYRKSRAIAIGRVEHKLSRNVPDAAWRRAAELVRP
ncbi:hypothetical protein F5B21DRAFT_510306 [Xylaria acuta]|nr:hypothetical protein F5B21DRAFT_510306 [Xylaria acuta]